MSAPQEQQPDQKRIVALLAEESHVPVDEVAKLYEQERAELASGAHVTRFLHIFATRIVLASLHKRDIEKPAALGGQTPAVAAALLSTADMPSSACLPKR